MSYKIQFTFRARVLDFVSDEPVPLQVDALSVCDETMAHYLPKDLADHGIVGGDVRLTAVQEKAIITIAFWSPQPLDDAVVNDLLRDTRVQLQDGLGENGFAFHQGDRLLVAFADIAVEPVRTIAHDSREVLSPPLAAVAARDGNQEGLKAALDSEPARIDGAFQGYAALHYAILYAHPELVELLVDAGADVNLLVSSGDSPLLLCAKAGKLSDEQAETIAKRLIEKGARIQLRDSAGQTAKFYAEQCGKPRLASLLG